MTFDELMQSYYLSDLENNRVSYDNLLEQAKNNNLTPLIGAGLACWAFPMWPELLKEQAKPFGMEKEIETMLQNNQFEEAASRLEAELSPNQFRRNLQQIYGSQHLMVNAAKRPAYQILLPLIFQGPILTTNFDRAIEDLYLQVQKNQQTPLDAVTPLDSFQQDRITQAMHQKKPLLLKLHGDVLDVTHIVLTKDQYDKAYGADPAQPDLSKPMPKYLQTALQRGPLLFLGCSLDADRTFQVIQGCSANRQHFALLPLPVDTKNGLHPILRSPDGKLLPALQSRRKQVLGSLNIVPIWYPAEMHNEALTAFFTQLADDLDVHPPPYEKKRNWDADFTPLHELLGRDQTVQDIAELLTGSRHICIWVSGPPGIGKTELCKGVYAELKNRIPDFSMPFIDLSSIRTRSAFLETTAQATGLRLPASGSVESKTAALLDDLTEFFKQDRDRAVLYFDNWETVWDALGPGEERNQLVKFLNGLTHRGIHLLVSSQSIHPDALLAGTPFQLTRLDSDKQFPETPDLSVLLQLDSAKLFLSVLGRNPAETELAAFAGLLMQLEGHPLSIVLTATQARHELNLTELLSRWDHAKQEGGGKHDSLETALRISWDALSSCPAAQLQWALHACSVLPIPLDTLTALGFVTDPENWQQGIHRLLDASLIQSSPNRQAVTMLLPLKQPFSRLSNKSDSLSEQAVFRWSLYFMLLLKESNDYNSEQRDSRHQKLVELLPQLFAILEKLLSLNPDSDHYSLASLLLRLLSLLAYNHFQYGSPSIQLLEKLILYFREQAPDLRLCARLLKVYGNQLCWLGQPNEAMDAYREAKSFCIKVGDNSCLAEVLLCRHDLLINMGQFDEANQELLDAHDVLIKNQFNIAVVHYYASIAQRFVINKSFDKALEQYNYAIAVCEEKKDNQGLANILMYRGCVYIFLGQFDKAQKSLEQAKSLFIRVRDDYGLFFVLIILCYLWFAKCKPQEVQKLLDQAENLLTKLNNPDCLAAYQYLRSLLNSPT